MSEVIQCKKCGSKMMDTAKICWNCLSSVKGKRSAAAQRVCTSDGLARRASDEQPGADTSVVSSAKAVPDAVKLKALLETKKVIESGWAGILPTGMIVDRRIHPSAIPIQANPLFNTPKPKHPDAASRRRRRAGRANDKLTDGGCVK